MNTTKLVIDTNTVISALCFPGSISRKFFNTVLPDPNCEILVSPSTVAELWYVLQRQKFDRFTPLEKRSKGFEVYLQATTPITPTETITVCRDPKDDQFLELAVAGEADIIITRDNDLLVLNPFREIEIMDAEAFLGRFGTNS